jgi:single-stranded-DNA-specific exonuclease
MAAGQNIGLAALAEAARLVKAPSCRDLGFALGPRINAGGRVGKSDLGVRLLTCTDPEEARTIASELDRLNEERRAIEMLVCEQAEEQAAKLNGASVITVMSAGWHQGVIGIVAGRIKERFGRPAIVIAECEDGTGKAQAGRSRGGSRRAVLAAKDSGLAGRGRRSRNGGGLTLAPAASSSSAISSTNGLLPTLKRHAATERCYLMLVAPGGVAGNLCDALTPRAPMEPAGQVRAWRLPDARLLRTGIVGDGMYAVWPAEMTARPSSGLPFGAHRRSWAGTTCVTGRSTLVARRHDQAR